MYLFSRNTERDDVEYDSSEYDPSRPRKRVRYYSTSSESSESSTGSSIRACIVVMQENQVPNPTSIPGGAADLVPDLMAVQTLDDQDSLGKELQRDDGDNMASETKPMTAILNCDGCTQDDITEEQQRAIDANITGDATAPITESELRWPDGITDDIRDTNSQLSQTSGDAMLTTRGKTAQRYISAFEISRMELAKLAIHQENELLTIFQSSDPEFETHLLTDICVPILACINDAVLRQIICGNLALAYRKDPEVREDLRKKRERGNTQPAIYMQLFVGPDGQSPSPAELAQLFLPVRSYCEPSKMTQQTIDAGLIDSAFNPPSRWGHSKAQEGKLKYLCDRHSSDPQISQNHISNILRFVDNLERRLVRSPCPSASDT